MNVNFILDKTKYTSKFSQNTFHSDYSSQVGSIHCRFILLLLKDQIMRCMSEKIVLIILLLLFLKHGYF